LSFCVCLGSISTPGTPAISLLSTLSKRQFHRSQFSSDSALIQSSPLIHTRMFPSQDMSPTELIQFNEKQYEPSDMNIYIPTDQHPIQNIPTTKLEIETQKLIQNSNSIGEQTNKQQKHILIVEDSIPSLKLLSMLLKKQNLLVTGVENGAAAIQLINEDPQQFHLILMVTSISILHRSCCHCIDLIVFIFVIVVCVCLGCEYACHEWFRLYT
jgi:hypothetical protein